MSKDKYTDYQLKIINGEIPIDTVRGNILARLKNKAIQLNDLDLVKKLEFELELKKEAAKKRNVQRNKLGYHERKKRGFAWKPAKTTVYTERQLKIINNDIPLDKVGTRELIAICQKAEANNDKILADVMLDLVRDKKAESSEKARIYKKRIRMQRREEKTIYFSRNGNLNKYETGILSGFIDINECSLEHLYHIKNVCIQNNDQENLEIIELLIKYVETPSILYCVHSHREALKLIEKLLSLPLY